MARETDRSSFTALSRGCFSSVLENTEVMPEGSGDMQVGSSAENENDINDQKSGKIYVHIT